MSTFRSGQDPEVWWLGTASNTFIQGSGVEGLTIDAQSGTTTAALMFQNAYDVFVRNVRIIGGNRGHISTRQVGRLSILDSYLYSANAFGGLAYGIDILASSGFLMQNNICHYMVTCRIGPAAGSVSAYNYAIDTSYAGGTDAKNYFSWFGTHDAGGGMELWEGNQANGFISDFPHGQSPLYTFFRNHFRGVDERTTSPVGPENRFVFGLQAYSRGYSIVGNVLGLNSLTFAYNCYAGVSGCASEASSADDLYVYYLGHSRGGSTVADSIVWTSLLRWGNYDTVSDAVRWCGNSSNTGWATTCSSTSEVPTTGITRLNGNPVPSTETLPESFYLSSQPSSWWRTPWGTPAWPPIGPDVTGGDHPDSGLGGRSYKIPARLCYDNATVDSGYTVTQRDRGLLLFNADTCYLSTNRHRFAPSINLRRASASDVTLVSR
jgi:hypothetical protein